MTVRINRSKRQRVVCAGCASILSYLPTDTRIATTTDVLGLLTYQVRVVDCPHCKTATILSTVQVSL
jgi:hypothetical protein